MNHKTTICVASGPSLSPQQLSFIQARRREGLCSVIAIGRTCQLLPGDVVYHADYKWWNVYRDSMPIDSILYTLNTTQERLLKKGVCVHGLEWTKDKTENMDRKIYHGGNSGQHAVDVARIRGAEKIILVGYDFQHTGGKAHIHEDYPKGWKNAEGAKNGRWVEEFKHVADYTVNKYGIDLVNCSIETAIDSCRRSKLEYEFE